MDAIVLENVTKAYDSVTAVNAVSLKVRAGAILGLLGPNGAGKTTTIRMIMHILVPDSGSIHVLGEPVSDSTRDKIGYLPEERGLYPRMKVLEIIVFLAARQGVARPPGAFRVVGQKAGGSLQGHATKSAVHHFGDSPPALDDSGRAFLRPRSGERCHHPGNHARHAQAGLHDRSLHASHGTG